MHNPITAKVSIQDLFDACKNAGYLPSVAVSAFQIISENCQTPVVDKGSSFFLEVGGFNTSVRDDYVTGIAMKGRKIITSCCTRKKIA